jgi:hypothetical protein
VVRASSSVVVWSVLRRKTGEDFSRGVLPKARPPFVTFSSLNLGASGSRIWERTLASSSPLAPSHLTMFSRTLRTVTSKASSSSSAAVSKRALSIHEYQSVKLLNEVRPSACFPSLPSLCRPFELGRC